MACKLIIIGLCIIISELCAVTGETCTYTRTPGQKSLNDAQPIGPKPIDECETLCTASSTCLAAYFDSPICYHATTTAMEPKAGAIHSLKVCVADTTPAPTSSSPETTSPASGTCSMVRSDNMRGGQNTFIKFKDDDISCRDLCRSLYDCSSVTFTGTQCKVYNQDTTTLPQTGSIHVVKYKCFSGIPCCLKTSYNTSGGNDHSVVYSNDLESCENMCSKYIQCTSVYWSGTECHIYATDTSTSLQTGSTFSKKTCTTGTTMGSRAFTTTCMLPPGNGRMATMDIMLIVMMCAVAIFY